MKNYLEQALRDLDLSPVLMDIGASGEPPPIWETLAPSSRYIGFDPDLREIHIDRLTQYRSSTIFNEVITEKDGDQIPFYLTKSPFCSTTLDPSPSTTAHWLERDLFLVQSHTQFRATTINKVMERLKLSNLDWIKLDTQGTDLRLLNSIAPSAFARMLAIDTEPGLIHIYEGEDMFSDVHRHLSSQGFWLSHLNMGGFYRMRRDTLETMHIDEPYVRRAVRKSPAYFEARYLRTLEWLADQGVPSRDYLLLWIFALTDNQLGFALDLNVAFERKFGITAASQQLKAATVQMLAASHGGLGKQVMRHLRCTVGRLLRA